MRYQYSQELKKLFFIRMMALALALLLPSMALAEVTPLAFQQDVTSREGLVRVRLSSLGNLESMTLNLLGDYAVNNGEFSLAAGTQVKISCNASTGQMTLSASGNSWNMGDYFTLNRSHAGASATIAQASNPYPADFSIRSTQQNGRYSLLPIAHIQMEDYLYGVLPYELGNNAPLEALKAQAIAARTYTIRMMTNRAGNQYDVVDTDADQVYRGTTSGNENCKAAVNATKGMVLKYGNRYAETYYSSSNGGQTESALNVWGGKGYDYLPVKDDPYDAASGSAKTKTATIYKDLASSSNRQTLLTLLKEKAVSNLTQNGYAASTNNTNLIWLEKITLHTPKYKAPSKLYTKADFQLTVETVAAGGGSVTTSVTVTADVFRELESMLGMSLTSSTNEIWTVSENSTAYTLKAGRYGHGVGMSQYGAIEMARQGYGFDAILGFYYPGCVNTKLNLTDEPMEDAGTPSVPGNTGETQEPEEPSAFIAGYATVIANGFVNLRAEPSMSAPILGIANEGDTVTVISLEPSWAYVEYEGITAYAMRSLLSEVFQKDTVPEITPTPTNAPSIHQPDTSVSNSHQLMIFCMDGFVNFRESPDRNGRILMQLPHGALLESLGSNGEFTHVSYQGIQGYVMTAYLVSASAMNPQTPAVTASPQPTPSPAATLVPESTPIPSEPDDSAYQTATVTTQRGSLNLRMQPSEHASILAKIPQYAQVEATQPQAGWCKVRYAGMEGYVMSSFLTFGVQTTPPPSKPEETIQIPSNSAGQAKVTTKSGSLNLRLSPQPHAAILTTIPRGRIVEVYSVNDGWALVSYQGFAGYVMTAYLTMQGSNHDNSNVETTPEPSVQPDAQPTQSPAQVLPPVPSMELPDGYTAVKDLLAVPGAGNANFRIAPSMNERILQAIPASEQLVVIATSDEWCIAQWQGMTGYVNLSEVSLYQADDLQ